MANWAQGPLALGPGPISVLDSKRSTAYLLGFLGALLCSLEALLRLSGVSWEAFIDLLCSLGAFLGSLGDEDLDRAEPDLGFLRNH